MDRMGFRNWLASVDLATWIRLFSAILIYAAIYTYCVYAIPYVAKGINTSIKRTNLEYKTVIKISQESNWTLSADSVEMQLCPAVPPNLVGPIKVRVNASTYELIAKKYPTLEDGGHWKPDCIARHKVAIIVPYRAREQQLRVLLDNLHGFLQKQQLDYAMILVEQAANQTFNRGKLMNVGYVEAKKLYPWECYVFHDVDLLPENDRNVYSCPEMPRHMAVAMDKFDYKLPYQGYFGGVTAVRYDHFMEMNGFSNDYWGWGGEDDDFRLRAEKTELAFSRPPTKLVHYKMMKHGQDKGNPVNECRRKLMNKTKVRMNEDGIHNLNYKILKFEMLPLYTHVLVDLLEKESRQYLKKEKLC